MKRPGQPRVIADFAELGVVVIELPILLTTTRGDRKVQSRSDQALTLAGGEVMDVVATVPGVSFTACRRHELEIDVDPGYDRAQVAQETISAIITCFGLDEGS